LKLKAKILLLHYGYPPQHTTGGIRLHKIKIHLQPYFTKVYTLPHTKKTVTYSQKIKNLWIARLLIHLRYSFPTNLLLGKDHLFYLISTFLKANQLLKKKGIIYLFTSYQPLSDLLIGLLLKKRNPHIFWIADFRDPYPEEIKARNIFPGLQRIVLKWIKNHCDLITVVSQGLKKHFEPFAQNIFVLYNGLDSNPKKIKIPILDYTFNGLITYTGSVYPQLTNPQPFLNNLLTLFPHARFLYLGKDADSWRKWLPYEKQHSVLHAPKSHNIAKKAQKKSDILLVFTWSNFDIKGVLTTKFFEYLNTNKLVLVLIQGDEDPEWESIGRLFPNCIICYAHACSLNQLQNKLRKISNTSLRIDIQKISKFLWTNNAAALIDTIRAST
jgi:hypothetical protein